MRTPWGCRITESAVSWPCFGQTLEKGIEPWTVKDSSQSFSVPSESFLHIGAPGAFISSCQPLVVGGRPSLLELLESVRTYCRVALHWPPGIIAAVASLWPQVFTPLPVFFLAILANETLSWEIPVSGSDAGEPSQTFLEYDCLMSTGQPVLARRVPWWEFSQSASWRMELCVQALV